MMTQNDLFSGLVLLAGAMADEVDKFNETPGSIMVESISGYDMSGGYIRLRCGIEEVAERFGTTINQLGMTYSTEVLGVYIVQYKEDTDEQPETIRDSE